MSPQAVSARAARVRSVVSFISLLSGDLPLRLLTQMDPGRVIGLVSFANFFTNPEIQIKEVAVVSGSVREPELLFLDGEFDVAVLSYEDEPTLFDLSKDWSNGPYKDHHAAYS
jgi:hypothetical protein